MAETSATARLEAQFAALRSDGGAARDPVRFAYLEALLRRVAAQPEAIGQRLQTRIGAAISELAARPQPVPLACAEKQRTSPLAELLAEINQHTHEPPDGRAEVTASTPAKANLRCDAQKTATELSRPAPELKSVAYFRNTWAKLSTEQLLTQTLAQAPENAGPMNSQHLVLRSLQVMRDIAPDYLPGFMSYIDTLIWLEHAAPTAPPATARAPGREGENKARRAKRSAKKPPASGG